MNGGGINDRTTPTAAATAPSPPRDAENERERHAAEHHDKIAGGGKVVARVEPA